MASPVHADPPESLDEAAFVARVREQSPQRAAHDARRRAAAAAVAVARTLPNPTLVYEREAVPGLDASDDFLRLAVPIDLAGRRGLGISAAGAAARAESLEVDRDALALVVEARLAYLEALYARDRLARLDEARRPLAELVDSLRSRANQGDASSYDADRAGLELDALDDDRAALRRTVELTQLALGAALGEPSKAYAPTGSLALPAKPASAPALQRAEIAVALARADRADRERQSARRGRFPKLELVAGVMATASAGGDGYGYVVGVGGELPLFDAGGARAAVASAEAKRYRAEAQALAIEVRGEVTRAYRDLILRIEQAETYLAGPASRAGDLARRAAIAYREGDRPILELLDVQRTARHSAARTLELIYEARRAELALQRAAGGQP